MIAEIRVSCLEHLKTLLLQHEASFSIFDPERPLRNFNDFYTFLMDIFAETTLSVLLHDCTYVSNASIITYPPTYPPLHNSVLSSIFLLFITVLFCLFV